MRVERFDLCPMFHFCPNVGDDWPEKLLFPVVSYAAVSEEILFPWRS